MRNMPTVPTVSVRRTWTSKGHFDFDQMRKLTLHQTPSVVEEVRQCGFTQHYDTVNDLIGTKKRRALNASMDKAFFNVTTSDDPVIQDIVAKDRADGSSASYTVYTTDTLLTVLMSSTRSVYPWDIVIEKNGNQIFIDKRSNNVEIDLLTVNETAREPPLLDNTRNSMQSLRKEATIVNQAFSQQVLRSSARDGKFEFEHPNPFQEDRQDNEISAVAYRYRRWKVSDDLNVVVRSEVDAVVKRGDDKPALATVKSLLEYPTSRTQTQGYEYGSAGLMEWRNNLDTQRGAVLVTEFRNNSNKMSRWIAQAILAGSQQFRLGFVSRVAPTNSARHVILAVERVVPNQFASQMEVNMNNMWAIVKHVVEEVIKGDDGRYVLVKEPAKSDMSLYLLPEGEYPEDEADVSHDVDDEHSVTTATEDEED